MTVQPESAPLMSARSLIHGRGHPSQGSRLRGSWRLETSDHLLATLGVITTTTHPHGAHARVRLTNAAVAGLGPLRGAWLR
jgi:hypothetical protein